MCSPTSRNGFVPYRDDLFCAWMEGPHRSQIASCCMHKSANYVMQKLIAHATASTIALFAGMLAESKIASRLTEDQVGCRIVQLTLLHPNLTSEIAFKLVKSLVRVTSWYNLLFHRWGNFVLQTIFLCEGLPLANRCEILTKTLTPETLAELSCD